jgi:UPF0755 protein
VPEDFNAFFDENGFDEDSPDGKPGNKAAGKDDDGARSNPVFAASASPEPPKPPRSRREMRRRRQRRRHTISKVLIIIVAILGVIFGGGYFGYVKLSAWTQGRAAPDAQVSDYPGPGSGSVQFVITSGEGVGQIAHKLEAAGVIKSQATFASTADANSSTLYPGTYELKYRMSSTDVIAILSDQSKATGFLEVRSGERVADVVTGAAKISGIDRGKFQAILDAKGAGILPAEAGGKFEGWLEPGTYDVNALGSANAIMKSMVDKRVTKLNELGVPAGAQRELTLIIASIAESEVNSNEYYGKVARVILNRLNKHMNLGMDTTVAYGLGISADKLTGKMLTDATNPYNTRVHAGLPPTPISNPGDKALAAAMNPPAGDWLYFVTTNLKTGETKFATTEAEFWKLRDEYKSSNAGAN